MSESEPTMDPKSPLFHGHRWIWVPIFVGTGISVAAQAFFFWLGRVMP